MFSTSRRISPAFVVSCLSLAVAMGSTAYATTVINGADIKNRSITGTKLVLNTVTGKEIKESSLGRVPSAAQASNATTVGHLAVRKVAKSIPIPASTTTSTTLFNLAGLKLVHGCLTSEQQTLTATASQQGILKLQTFDEDNASTAPFYYEAFNLRPTDGAQALLSGISDSENVMGRLIWQTASGHVITFDFQLETNAFGGADDCTVGGTFIGG